MSFDADRLRRLLGDPQLSGLRNRLRARFERGEQRDEFTLTGLSSAERRALEGLLGRAAKTAGAMRLSLTGLDRAMARAGVATNLRSALELLDGPITDRRAERAEHDHAWRLLIDGVHEPRLRALIDDPGGAALLKRFAGSDVSHAEQLLEQARRVLARLPFNGIPLAHVAAEVLGDSHALDAGQPVATLVLRACKVEVSPRTAENPGASEQTDGRGLTDEECDAPDRSVREQWARLGVSVNELAAPVLCLNLPVEPGSPGGEVICAASRYGEPVHLTLRTVLRHPPVWNVANRVVHVCENPSIVALAADRLDSRCAPLVCTDGMPSAAQRTLLRQLAAAGAKLRYHGDFDWPGLRIGNFVMRELGAEPWRFAAEDYMTSGAETGPPLPAQQQEALWDAALAGVMAQRGFAVHEERVAAILLRDLAAG